MSGSSPPLRSASRSGSGSGARVQAASALKPDSLLLHLLPAALAAALQPVPLLLDSRQSSVPSRARPCRVRPKCTTRALGPPPHWSRTATYATRHGAAAPGRTNLFPAAARRAAALRRAAASQSGRGSAAPLPTVPSGPSPIVTLRLEAQRGRFFLAPRTWWRGGQRGPLEWEGMGC